MLRHPHKIEVVVATGNKSPIKFNATVAATKATELDATVICKDARSDIDAQPEGRAMGEQGAENRAVALRPLYPNAYIVGMEDYLDYDEDERPVNRTAVVVMAPDGREYNATSTSIPFDRRDVSEARKRGFKTTTVGDVLAERIGGDPANPHGPMSGYARDRESIHTSVLIRVFTQIKKRLDKDLLDLTNGEEAFHELKAGRHTVRLPLGAIKREGAPDIHVAFFDLFGTPALGCGANELLARALAPRLPEGVAAVIIPEGKSVIAGVALAGSLGTGGVPAVMLRKKNRPMRPAVKHVIYKSVTTAGEQKLHIDADTRRALESLRGKTVLVFDDVVSTGGTIKAVWELLQEYDIDVYFGFIFTEGTDWKTSIDPTKVIALGALPFPVPPPDGA